jgi:ribosomal-protein-alanine N-acetyltransferase
MKTALEKYKDAFPELSSSRLLLRAINKDDAESLYANFSDEEVMKYYNHYPYTSIEQVDSVIKIFTDNFAEGVSIRWAIVLKEKNEVIGTIGLNYSSAHPFSVEMGYELNRREWGKGITTEAISLVKEFAFHQLGLVRIQARTKPENIGSWKTLEKSGFEREGLLRKQSYWKNESHDVFLYAVINNKK